MSLAMAHRMESMTAIVSLRAPSAPCATSVCCSADSSSGAEVSVPPEGRLGLLPALTGDVPRRLLSSPRSSRPRQLSRCANSPRNSDRKPVPPESSLRQTRATSPATCRTSSRVDVKSREKRTCCSFSCVVSEAESCSSRSSWRRSVHSSDNSLCSRPTSLCSRSKAKPSCTDSERPGQLAPPPEYITSRSVATWPSACRATSAMACSLSFLSSASSCTRRSTSRCVLLTVFESVATSFPSSTILSSAPSSTSPRRRNFPDLSLMDAAVVVAILRPLFTACSMAAKRCSHWVTRLLMKAFCAACCFSMLLCNVPSADKTSCFPSVGAPPLRAVPGNSNPWACRLPGVALPLCARSWFCPRSRWRAAAAARRALARSKPCCCDPSCICGTESRGPSRSAAIDCSNAPFIVSTCASKFEGRALKPSALFGLISGDLNFRASRVA
mmetsp:Transcript_13775/g.37304  ORF Transcript_13775/g.37304 Transcript_13775/m.37304 type:complete len:442 (+) Transcript_13775:466-1791(+)